MTTITRAHDVARTEHGHAIELISAEVNAMGAVVRGLAPSDWLLPTDCTGWDVHSLVAHIVGNAENILDPDLMQRRAREGTEKYPQLYLVDAMNEMAVDDWRDKPSTALVDEFNRLWPRAVEALRTMPESARQQTFESGYPDVPTLTFGYICDVIFTRDMWMHRVDLCRATGKPFAPGEHSRDVIAQILRDLDDAWEGDSFVLELTGATTGDWQIGAGEPVLTVGCDAVEFLRNLSGRTEPEPALTVVRGDPALLDMVREARLSTF